MVGLKGDRSFVMADIPGLIEGASEGVGLGHEFLRHIERCKVLIHVVDASGSEGRDPVEDIRTINDEIAKYDPRILQKPMIIACNKTDLIIDEQGNIEKVTPKVKPDTNAAEILAYLDGQA